MLIDLTKKQLETRAYALYTRALMLRGGECTVTNRFRREWLTYKTSFQRARKDVIIAAIRSLAEYVDRLEAAELDRRYKRVAERAKTALITLSIALLDHGRKDEADALTTNDIEHLCRIFENGSIELRIWAVGHLEVMALLFEHDLERLGLPDVLPQPAPAYDIEREYGEGRSAE